MADVTIEGLDATVHTFRALGSQWAPGSGAVRTCVGEMGAFMVDSNRQAVVKRHVDVDGRPFKPIRRSTAVSPAGGTKGKNSLTLRGGGHPLVSGGGMMRALMWQHWGQDTAVVFFASGGAARIAAYHQFGTAGPYPIRPKGKKALAIPGLGLIQGGKATGLTGKGGVLGGAKSRRKSVTAKGGAFAKGTVVVKHVMHPGLPARKHLGFRAGDDAALMDIVKRHLGGVVDRVT